MPKTITMRIDDNTYELFSRAAAGTKRTISNFIEFATLNFLVQDTNVSDREMDEILNNKPLLKSLEKGREDVKKGKYRLV